MSAYFTTIRAKERSSYSMTREELFPLKANIINLGSMTWGGGGEFCFFLTLNVMTQNYKSRNIGKLMHYIFHPLMNTFSCNSRSAYCTHHEIFSAKC